MRRYRPIATAALLAASCLLAVPATATASSTLLSGYGSPGEGNQAIIGSTLIGGGGGAGGGGSSGSAPSSASSAEASPSATATTGTGAAAGSAPKTSRGSGGRHGGSERRGRSSRPSSPAGGGRAAAPVAVKGASYPLGVTGEDLLWMILALLALAGTAVATALLVRGPQRSPGR